MTNEKFNVAVPKFFRPLPPSLSDNITKKKKKNTFNSVGSPKTFFAQLVLMLPTILFSLTISWIFPLSPETLGTTDFFVFFKYITDPLVLFGGRHTASSIYSLACFPLSSLISLLFISVPLLSEHPGSSLFIYFCSLQDITAVRFYWNHTSFFCYFLLYVSYYCFAVSIQLNESWQL